MFRASAESGSKKLMFIDLSRIQLTSIGTPAFDAFACFSGILEVLKIFREFPMTKDLH
jgi:uncharacterized membrane protein YphA (DoxX/SURF4 family)